MRENLKPCIIFSAELSSLSEPANALRSETTRELLTSKGISFKELQGAYKGSCEVSFLVIDTEKNRSVVMPHAFETMRQESVLCLDDLRRASLVYASGATESIGSMHSVSEKEALKHDAYSTDGDQYWICT